MRGGGARGGAQPKKPLCRPEKRALSLALACRRSSFNARSSGSAQRCQDGNRMRGVTRGFGMLFTPRGRLKHATFEHPNTRGELEQVLGNWEESDEGRRVDGPAAAPHRRPPPCRVSPDLQTREARALVQPRVRRARCATPRLRGGKSWAATARRRTERTALSPDKLRRGNRLQFMTSVKRYPI